MTLSRELAALSRAVVAERLAALPPMAGVAPEAVAALAGVARRQSVEAGERVLAQGETSDRLYVLLDGRVKMSRALASGRDVVLALFGPGEVFGSVAALGGEPCDASLVALERSVVLVVEGRALLALFEARPALVPALLPVLVRRLVECRNCIVEAACLRVETRFAHLFAKLAASVGETRPEGTFVPIALSRRELADMTGTTIETAIRVMSRWGKDGVVATRDDGFLVLDAAALAAAAEA